jgi:hypothetical protein
VGLFLLLAIICFVLAAIGVNSKHVSFGWLGLALWAFSTVHDVPVLGG